MRDVQDWDTALPTQRNHGDCIESNVGNSPNARFTLLLAVAQGGIEFT